MTGEEMERAIEIILHNQANFELQFEKTNRQMERTDARLETLAGQMEALTERVETIGETQTEFIQIVLRHIEAQGEINASLRGMMREQKETTRELKDSQLRLTESQTRTDERLDRLAETVERYINERRNGNS
ncbi:MAG: hypothetical protein WCF57_06615 [Pyrinomonadaceae bacterium]